MASDYLHIISFDIPYPADYGGVIDVFHKIKALHQAGIKVILHCYEYGRQRSEELEKNCHKVHYYKRYIYRNPFSGEMPYIVSTRSHHALLEELCRDDHPILFEGLHTTYFLGHERLKNRKKMVRTHNVEHEYYARLSETAGNYIKRRYFKKEAERLKIYEQELKHAEIVLAISPKDVRHFRELHSKVIYLPAFHPNEQIHAQLKDSPSDFVLYHGNLSVGENDEAARFLVREIWKKDFDIPLVIAGNGASGELTALCKRNPNITLASPTSSAYIDTLIKQARLNLLVTFQDTGIKLKLLNALYNGRHCLVNDAMIRETGLEPLCVLMDPVPSRTAITQWFDAPYTLEQQDMRAHLLEELFSNRKNIRILTEWL